MDKYFFTRFKKHSDNIFFDEKLNRTNRSKSTKKKIQKITEKLKTNSTRKVLQKINPLHIEMIFSEHRAIGLELLDIKGDESLIDLGCMMGEISIPISKQVRNVIGIDKNLEFLIYANQRVKEDGIENIKFINADVSTLKVSNSFDIAVINGVLQWISERFDFRAKSYFKNLNENDNESPINLQKAYLKKAYDSLKVNGKLYLAIENKYDYRSLFAINDYSNFKNILSKKKLKTILKKKKYKTQLYSFSKISKIIQNLGFKNINIYSTWPNYFFPEQIYEYGKMDSNFNLSPVREKGKIKVKFLIRRFFEILLFRLLKLDFFAPSIIIIAEK